MQEAVRRAENEALDPILAALSFETIEWLKSFRDGYSLRELADRFSRDERTIAMRLVRLDEAFWVSKQLHILHRELGQNGYRLTKVGKALVDQLERVASEVTSLIGASPSFAAGSNAGMPSVSDAEQMRRITIDQLSPRAFEDMVSVLLSRELKVRRINGAGNIGGEDCYFADEECEDIYEVKSFTGRMSQYRRHEVERSLARAMEREPSTWTLVVPIDPTPAELEWFRSLQAGVSARLAWKGKTWLEDMLAWHSDMARYFAAEAENVEQHLRNVARRTSTQPGAPGGHVFISYVSEDSKTVDRLQHDLESAGIMVWRDRSSLGPGDRWKDSIRHAIATGAYFLCCFSEASGRRERSYMNEELNLAVEELRVRSRAHVWFLPIIFPGGTVPAWPVGAGGTLRDFNYTVLSYDIWEEGMTKLVRTIQSPR